MSEKGFILNKKLAYFKNYGVDIMPFDDFYPSGHRLCVTIIMHGNCAATCGDIRFEQTPGKWQPIPKQIDKKLTLPNQHSKSPQERLPDHFFSVLAAKKLLDEK